MNPTCQHPECHDTRTNDYRWSYRNSAAGWPGRVDVMMSWGGHSRRPDLQKYGWAIG